MAGWEAPSGKEQQWVVENQNIPKTPEQIEAYEAMKEKILSLNEEWSQPISRENMEPLLRSIDWWDFTDEELRNLFDLARDAIAKIGEPVRTDLDGLLNELEKDNNNLPDWASIDQIAEFINDDSVKTLFMESLNWLDVPGNADTPSVKMAYWEEHQQWLKAILETGSEDSLKDFAATLTDFQENPKIKTQELVKDFFAKHFGEKAWEVANEKFAKLGIYQESISELATIEWVDLNRIDVTRRIMEHGVVNDENREALVTELKEMSWKPDNNQKATLEKIIAETNNMDAKKAHSFFESRKEIWSQASSSLINFENDSWFDILSMIRKSPMLMSFLNMAFWPEFIESISEPNVMKQKALTNLAKLSDTKNEWFTLPAAVDLNIEWKELKDFFASMDSHGVDYSKQNFWENILTGTVEAWAEDEATTVLHNNLVAENENYFTFSWDDFGIDNEWFLKRLKEIEKKDVEENEGNLVV